MKIETIEDLDRLLALVNKHEVEELTVGEVTVRKSAHFPKPEKAPREDEWDDEDLDPYYASSGGD